MTKTISELRQVPAANEHSYAPRWIDDVPDDWSHTINVASEFPVMNRQQLHDKQNSVSIFDEVNTVKAA